MTLIRIPGAFLLACMSFAFFSTNANSAKILRNPNSDWIEHWCGSANKGNYPANIVAADAWSQECTVIVTIEPKKREEGKGPGCKATQVRPDVLHIVGRDFPTIRWKILSSTANYTDFYFDQKDGVSLSKSTADFTWAAASSQQEFTLTAKNGRFAAFQYDIKALTKINNQPVVCDIVDPLVITHG
jgi:hypothetical protein